MRSRKYFITVKKKSGRAGKRATRSRALRDFPDRAGKNSSDRTGAASNSASVKTISERRLDGEKGRLSKAEPREIWKARNFIHEHAGEEISLKMVAKSVNISANHLSEKFKEVTGVNFVKYVAHSRYEKARALLHDLNVRVSEAAFAAGFQSLSQFNRVFRNLAGKSPTEYRAVARQTRTGRNGETSAEFRP